MPDLIEGLTYVQECCGAVFTVVEGREDGVRDAVTLLGGNLKVNILSFQGKEIPRRQK